MKLDTDSRVPEYTIFHALGDFVNDKNTREKISEAIFLSIKKESTLHPLPEKDKRIKITSAMPRFLSDTEN